MSSNAIRGPRRAAQTGANSVSALRAGDRAPTPTPSSGIRSAPLGPSDATPAVGVHAIDPGNMHASAAGIGASAGAPGETTGSGPRRRYDKVDMGRLQFDSDEMTHIATPNPTLLAIARGERPRLNAPRRLTWFAWGMTVGAVFVWCATSDVRADVFAVRVHIASILRSLRGESEPPPAMLVTEGRGARESLAHAPPSPTQAHDAKPLSDAKTAPPAATPIAIPAPLNGAPTLPNAPGPR